MVKRLTLPQLKKYDITQKVIESLANSESRAIIFSIVKKEVLQLNFPINSKYPLVQFTKNF